MEDKSKYRSEAWSAALDEKVIELRKRWLDFSRQDEELVAEVDVLLRENIDPMIEDMYSHFLSFEDTKKFFPDEATLRRAQTAQKAYFLRLCKGNYDREYVSQRLAVGDTHYRIGLDPTWYLGAYNRVFSWCRNLVHERCKDNFEKYMQVISALTRLIFFDMGLAIEAYSIAKEDAIRQHRDAISLLETERRATKNILQDAPIGIVQLDEALNIIESNTEFLGMIGETDRDKVIGKPWREVSPNLDLTLIENVLRTGEPYKAVAEYLNVSQEAKQAPTYFDWAIWPVRMERESIRGLVATFSDATDRVLLHQQREDFVATLTHDLKTPILAANRAIKLLIEGDFGKVEESQQRILETIHQSNDSMYRMVQTLLDVYRYDSGLKNLNLVETDVAAMVKQMVEELQPLASSRGVSLETNLPPSLRPIRCDDAEIRRVLQNLMDNAMKFTASGGTISVRVEQSDSMTIVSVRDTGKGISDEDKPKLFQRFWAAASSGRYYASTGLGLYLCRKIVELHSGKIWVESAVGKGSTFHFSIANGLTC